MQIKKLAWTNHSQSKMRFYGLSQGRIKRVIHSPERIEEGIAPGTIAFMQAVKTRKHPYEIWVMVTEGKKEHRVISAWRYPGRTKPGDPLPEAILREMQKIE
ncbi:hypothetical protein HY504_03280 [Candidatus Wolfebacteria bacterium]|nr:hypothetical protein [Candidatus Wolfebacteria bacterium]